MTNLANRATTSYYRQAVYGATQAQAQRPDVRDDYERWYTETVPNNRMALSLRSGIHSEVSWALDRLCRLCYNDQFLLKTIPGLIDGLFEWPEWYISEGHKVIDNAINLFSPPPEYARQRRFALESLFVLRNSALNESNALEIYNHSHTLPLILNALNNLNFEQDENIEFLVYCMDLLPIVAIGIQLHSSKPNPLPPLLRIVSRTRDRSLIIGSLTALYLIFSNPSNTAALSATSPALAASIRYLPLVIDKPLLDACLNYLYAHISHVSMARAFLLRPEMPSVLKLLVNVLLVEQPTLEEKVTVDISGTIHTVPANHLSTRIHELTKEELDSLVEIPEPQRCYDWMKLMFVAKADGVVTQVDFWNLYKDTFTPYIDKYPLLVASDVIKNVNAVFPTAQAMVLQDPVQRFVVQGVDRRKDSVVAERFRCLWDRSQCAAAPFSSASELYDHVLQHLERADTSQSPCLWGSCSKGPLPRSGLQLHVLIHLSSTQLPPKHPSQSDTITLSSADSQFPIDAPTQRPPPPPRSTVITYERPTSDPSSTSLTALLVLRILFRTSFASADVAPRADGDHFGFPGIVEDTGDHEHEDVRDETSEREGESRGRKGFVGVRYALEKVKIKDEALMAWISEMVV